MRIVMVERVRNEMIQLGEEMMVNFATAENVIRVARHTAGMIIAHPLQVVWIVSASFKAPGVPRPKALALGAKHLVTPLGLVNGNLAIGAGFSVVLQESDRGNRVGVTNVERVIALSLEFPAMCTGVLVTGAALPGGRDEAVAVGISTAVNKLCVLVLVLVLVDI